MNGGREGVDGGRGGENGGRGGETRGPRAMTGVRVWAPDADEVLLIRGDERSDLERGEGGWWHGPPLPPGTDYWFAVDGEGPFPDPRSRWQPHGVHGPSRVLDPAEVAGEGSGFRAPPLASGIVYELHVGTFSSEGTFDGAIPRLDHLVDLGVTHVELMPVAQFPGDRGWGYDGAALYAPHAPYGGPQGLRRFVDACHDRGLAVLLDVVYNHLGPEGNHLARFGPYFTERYGTPWGQAVNLDDRGSDEVRRFFVDNALMWLGDYGIDGLRIDAVHALFDHSALHFLEELEEAVRTLGARTGRHLVLIAESDLNDPRVVTPREAGGWGMDAQWSDDFHHAIHALLTGDREGYYRDFGSLEHVARALEQGFVYDGRYSAYRGRRHGRPLRERRGSRLLGYLQNHDQVGNRATGERFGALTSPARVRIGAALVLTAPFVPLLFQGEEWGASTPFLYFTHVTDPDLGRAIREGRRREFAGFGWRPEEIPDPQDPQTFERSRLKWDEREDEQHRELLEWYGSLIRLRRTHPDLLGDRMPEVRFDEEEGWLASYRGSLTVAFNVGAEPRRVPLGGHGGRDRNDPDGPRLLMAFPDQVELDGGRVLLPPDSIAIVEG